eukprot:CAMPEP_0172303854 /NCGR_PEP_ID=MMETSP1058-20130122/5370_1 /TAXON_ID=83371 /ORGANISM="Detonula confervacea, Strain CCMP 353" /LENGTH=726 /DNA_ID=CAMNT_0013014883 /DNA_START=343 /DNA_END=2523 /DNA_ORIENTATION=+
MNLASSAPSRSTDATDAKYDDRRWTPSSKNRPRQSSASGRTPSSSAKKANGRNNVPLASGISSRRTSQNVKSHHLPSRSGNASSSSSSAPSSKSNREKRPQVPMEHDGGILCLCAIPPNSDNQQGGGARHNNTHRFLSGGADGTIKLWEVNEPPPIENDVKDNAKMVPKLIRTYNGHSGYVHCIAVLGTSDYQENNTNSRSSFMRRSSDDRYSRDSKTTTMNMNRIPSISSMRRRSSHLSGDSSGSYSGAQKEVKRKRLVLFVSASRDNTLRIWPIVEHDNTNTNTNNNEQHHFEQDDASLDESERSVKSRELSLDDSISTKGMKLRGHEFGKNNNMGGVLCVCAVPSLLDDDDASNGGFHNHNEMGSSGGGGGGMISAGQFCSGGSDGRVRVWDVRSALNLKKIPKSGMYATVQLQCINSDPAASNNGHIPPAGYAAITSLVCSTGENKGGRGGEVSLFAGNARGAIRRYSRMNECAEGHVNSAIWWGCTGIFGGHCHPITSMAMLSSASLMPLLCPANIDEEEEDEDANDDVGTMLVSSCEDGWVRVWDAFDARGRMHSTEMLDSSERSHDDYVTASGRIPKRRAMWEIELNDGEDDPEVEDYGCNSQHAADGRRRPPTTINVRTLKDRIGVTSLTTLQAGTLMVAGTTDGQIRMWNVSSGMYEAAYNLGKSVQIWSLGMLSEQDAMEEYDEYGEMMIRSVGIIVSGDNRGRIRVMRKVSSRSV